MATKDQLQDKDTKLTTITEALSNVMKEVGAVGKSEKNQAQGFNFRGIDAVKNAVSPALQKHGVVPFFQVEHSAFDQVATRNGGSMTRARVTLKAVWTVIGSDEVITSSAIGEAFDSGDKATTKAHSVAERIIYLQTLCLPTDEPDPDTYSHEQVEPVRMGEVEREGWLGALQDSEDIDALQERLAEVWKIATHPADRQAFQQTYNKRKAELETEATK